MNLAHNKKASLILISFVVVFAISLSIYSIKHLPISIANYVLHNISSKKNSSLINIRDNYFNNLEDAVMLAKDVSKRERDNSNHYLSLSRLCFDTFNLESGKKYQILKTIKPSDNIDVYNDSMLIAEIFKLIYSSLNCNPSNYKPFLYLSNLVNLKLNSGEGYIDSEIIKEAQVLTHYYIEKALSLNPSKAQIIYASARYFLQIGEIKKAAIHFRKVLNLNNSFTTKIFSEISHEKDTVIDIILEKSPQLQMLYADFLVSKNNYADAERYYSNSFELSADKSEIYRKLCQLYFTNGNNDKARAISERMIDEGYARNDEDLSLIFYNLSSYFEKENDFSSAIKHAKKAIENNQSEIKNYFLLSKLYLKISKPDQAISNLKFIFSHFDSETIKNSKQNIHFLLAEAYEMKDDIVKAYEEYNKALKLEPNNKEIQKRINFIRKGLI